MRKAILSLLVLFTSLSIQAQQVLDKLYGVYSDQADSYHFINPDISSAAVTNIGSVLPITDHFLSASALNRNSKVYFLGAEDTAGVKRLYQINLEDGSIMASPALDQSVSDGRLELQYNNGNNKLYGLNLKSGDDDANIVEINPATGVLSLIKTINPVDSKINGSSTIDEINNRYFFNGADEFADSRLYTVDLDSGVILSQPGYSGALLSPPFEMEYDPINEKLYGLNRDDNGVYHFASISINTALVTNLDVIGGMSGIFSGSSSFDPINRRYFVNGFDTDNKKRLYVIDVDAEDGISEAEYSVSAFNYSMELEYMYQGIIGVEENELLPLQVYPNPASDNIWFDIPFTGSLQVEVYDMMGKLMLSKTLNRPGLNKLAVSGFTPGMYSIRASEGFKNYSGLVVVQ